MAVDDITEGPECSWREMLWIRRTIADALVNGNGIEMAGGTKAAEGRCPE